MLKWVQWSEMQTGQQVQCKRHDRGTEYMTSQLKSFYREKGIQTEPTAGYSPEANGIAERRNLALQDTILPMLADSADPAYGLPPLSDKFAVNAVIYANDMHNAKPAGGHLCQ
jgi:transposase InsO family protein